MQINFVYNNSGCSDKLKTGWGFAAWISLEQHNILFDTGGDGDILAHNLTTTGLDISKLSAVVISHQHWDHIGGLPYLLSQKPEIPILIPPQALEHIKSKVPNANFKTITEAQKLYPDLWTTGPMEGTHRDKPIWEQSLVLTKGQNAYIISGCSHSGIVNIARQVMQQFPCHRVELLIGGYHLKDTITDSIQNISRQLQALGVRRIAPSHCTGDQAVSIFKANWQENFIALGLGSNYQFH